MKEAPKPIHYSLCPHFTVGRVDQWGEQGYFYYESYVYGYSEDRKSQHTNTASPRTITAFISYAKANKVEIPATFLAVLKG